MNFSCVRRNLYRGARILGDVQAAQRGPKAAGKRVVRRAAYRSVNRGLGQLLRKGGLS